VLTSICTDQPHLDVERHPQPYSKYAGTKPAPGQ
jgi:hypothetical protein